MNLLKKTAIYAVIIAALVAASMFAGELRSINYDAERQTGARPAPRGSARSGEFIRPPEERNGPMSEPELAWLMRERITLDVMEGVVTGGGALDAYNDRARGYNRLAAAIQYKESDMASAERAVNSMKRVLVSGALDEAMLMCMPDTALRDGRVAIIWRAQKYLKMFGYYPGEADGRENESTASALKLFLMRQGLPDAGIIDEALVSSLRELWIDRHIPENAGFSRDDG